MADEGNSEITGRSKHLGQLALVFKHRHGTWTDFGLFLKILFRGEPSSGRISAVQPSRECGCRHNFGGRHHAILAAAALNPEEYPMFAHERYSRPCITLGAWEKGKNPGLVVDDLCIKAAEFLRNIGKGDSLEKTGRDFEYEPESQQSQFSEAMSTSPEPDGPIRDVSMEPVPVGGGQVFDGDDLFDDDDVVEALVEEYEELGTVGAAGTHARPRSSGTSISTPTGYLNSDDSRVQSSVRSSTKLRAATLGYLAGFADDPQALRREFKRLRGDASLWVLHLCGCGLCYGDAGKPRFSGCVEYSHLRLGFREENKTHTNLHFALNFVNVEDYAGTCSSFHKREAEGGDGLF